MEWAFHVVRLSNSMPVEMLQIKCAPGGPIGLRSYHHPGTPRNRRIWANFFQDTQIDIALQIPEDLFLPVNGDQGGLMDCEGLVSGST